MAVVTFPPSSEGRGRIKVGDSIDVRTISWYLHIEYGLVAQLVEQRPFKPKVPGSIPGEPTMPKGSHRSK